MIEIRTLEKSDIPEVVEDWNQSLMHDKVSEERFENVILKDPNYEKEGNFVALDQGKIVGFVSAVAREGVSGKDGKGRSEEKDDGYIKGFFVLDNYWDTGIEEKLLDEATEYLKSKHKSVIKVVVYTGSFFFPGIDMRYERLLYFFDENGFERISTVGDVAVNLTDFEPTEYHKEARRRIAKIGVEITKYHPGMLEKMREYVERLDMKQWFPEGWEERFSESGHTLVALKGADIVGWANYWPGKERGEFGPIGVLEELRGNGIGICLLLESMLRMKELNTPRAIAAWAATGFYSKSGWEVCRQYVVFQKEL